MALTFPPLPNNGDEHEPVPGKIYRYDGTVWRLLALPSGGATWGQIVGDIDNQTDLSTTFTTLVINGGNITPLVDLDENVESIFNSGITGNLLTNATINEPGITLSIQSFTINTTTYTPSAASVDVPDVGSFVVESNGDWSFIPVTEYFGPIPVVSYVVLSSDGKTNNSTLTISDIIQVIDGGNASSTYTVTIDGGTASTTTFDVTIDGGTA